MSDHLLTNRPSGGAKHCPLNVIATLVQLPDTVLSVAFWFWHARDQTKGSGHARQMLPFPHVSLTMCLSETQGVEGSSKNHTLVNKGEYQNAGHCTR